MLKSQCLTVLAAIALIPAQLVAQDRAIGSGFVRASQVTGTEIRNSDNQNLGTIEDVVLDRDSGTAFVIVNFGAAVDTVDNKLHAVPWTALKAG